MAMSDWSSLFSAGAQILGSLGSSGMSIAGSSRQQRRAYEYNRKLQQHQYDLMQKGYLETPGNQRAGLESAGYNPILAVSNGMSFGNVSGAGGVSANSPDIKDLGSSISNATQLRLQSKQIDSNVKAQNAEANYKNSLAQSELTKQLGYQVDNEIKRLDSMLKAKDLSTYDRRFINDMREQLERTKSFSANAAANMLSAQAARQNATTNAKLAPSQISLNNNSAVYQRQRSRGYQDTWSNTRSGSLQHPRGLGGYSSSVTRTRSRTR